MARGRRVLVDCSRRESSITRLHTMVGARVSLVRPTPRARVPQSRFAPPPSCVELVASDGHSPDHRDGVSLKGRRVESEVRDGRSAARILFSASRNFPRLLHLVWKTSVTRRSATTVHFVFSTGCTSSFTLVSSETQRVSSTRGTRARLKLFDREILSGKVLPLEKTAA